MQTLKSIGYIILTLFKGVVSLCQEIWLLITDMIDDEDDETQQHSPADNTSYNYRTGETTSYKRSDGIYHSDNIHDDP